MRLCFANQFSGFHTILFLGQRTRKAQSIFRCTCQLCGLICASTTKLEQHVAKKTCQKRQKEAVEQGVTPSEFPSPPPSKLFAISQGAASLNSQHRALLFSNLKAQPVSIPSTGRCFFSNLKAQPVSISSTGRCFFSNLKVQSVSISRTGRCFFLRFLRRSYSLVF